MNKDRLIIVIPVYNSTPKKTEIASLKHFGETYDWNYDVRFICPESFSVELINLYIKLINAPDDVYVQYKPYPDSYFKSTKDYSRLMKSNSFYRDFVSYEYMMILQTDVWVTSINKIDDFIDEGFDYIGAPILTNKKHWPSAPCCGNGGLSLRKVQSFIEYTSDDSLISRLNENPVWNDYEDVFFCEGISKYLYIDMPTWEDCSLFAYDMNPDILWERTNGHMPEIGIHAWPKNIPFWKDKLDIPEDAIKEAMDENASFIQAYYV